MRFEVFTVKIQLKKKIFPRRIFEKLYGKFKNPHSRRTQQCFIADNKIFMKIVHSKAMSMQN